MKITYSHIDPEARKFIEEESLILEPIDDGIDPPEVVEEFDIVTLDEPEMPPPAKKKKVEPPEPKKDKKPNRPR